MKTLFLGHFAATVAPRILAKVKTPLETSVLNDEGDAAQLASLLADAEIVVGHIWRAGFPPAPRLRLLQSVAAGLDLLDTAAVPKGVTICNVFGHEQPIAEYVIMTMLVLTHCLFEAATTFRGLVEREPAVWQRLLARRSAGPHDRDHRLWPDRARGGGTRGGA
jgi:phosphoglycerate dehydrogenase-like enzyme